VRVSGADKGPGSAGPGFTPEELAALNVTLHWAFIGIRGIRRGARGDAQRQYLEGQLDVARGAVERVEALLAAAGLGAARQTLHGIGSLEQLIAFAEDGRVAPRDIVYVPLDRFTAASPAMQADVRRAIDAAGASMVMTSEARGRIRVQRAARDTPEPGPGAPEGRE
jgi:hypothetical protein